MRFFLFFLSICVATFPVHSQVKSYVIDASLVTPKPVTMIPMYSSNMLGLKLSMNNQYFEKDGKPWFPLMGEMHYNRIPPEDWETGILKMKAAGIGIVATYVFWNEHETAPGVWDWRAKRDLRRFVKLCANNGMYVWLRIGPWCHGEQLYGGHPAWIDKMQGKRTNDAAYVAEVTKLFGQIGVESRGLFFKNGGPIIGVQLENEYANGEAAHISKLKQMALAANITPVFWTVTANSVFNDKKMEVIPLQGSYCYRGWEKGGGGPTIDFLYGDDQWIMTDALGGKLYYDASLFPRGMCEQGGGSQMTYANRFVVEPHVEEAHVQNQIGRGMNLIGYYMFHGGTQARGLKEPGLPYSYDFQAPIGEFGIIRPSYKYMKIIHQFVNNFGEELAPMQPVSASNPVKDPKNTSDLRYIARVNGNSGFLFLCNTQVRVTMPDKQVKIQVKLATETISFPEFNFKGQTTLIFPFNLKINDVLIKYATAQPLAKIESGNTTTLFLIQPEGVHSEIAVDQGRGSVKREKLILAQPKTFMGISGKKLIVILLSRKEAENSWCTKINGKDVLVISEADLINNGKILRLQQAGNNHFKFKIYPKNIKVLWRDKKLRIDKSLLYSNYNISVPLYSSDSPSHIKQNKALVTLPAVLPVQLSDVLLKINYLGGGATVVQDQDLLSDNLFNGTPWLFSSKNFIGKGPLQFEVQAWKDNTTGMDSGLIQKIKSKTAAIEKVEVIPQYKIDIEF